MKPTSRAALALLLAASSLQSARADAPAATAVAAPAGRPAEPSQLAPTPPSERRGSDGRIRFRVGRLEGTLPEGWTSFTVAGQTTYRSADLQEQLRIFGYAAAAPLDGASRSHALAGLIDASKQAELLIARFARLTQSPPRSSTVEWGPQAGFYTVGPLTRIAFHYATVGEREALMFQLDGTGETHSGPHTIAILQSLHLVP